ncbi:alpha/beta fold hydrolase [Halococcus salsus]|uniref:alpha/beta fold hydrolase n=1 Tax=Halococcus salsus TaxID=2162894 RepID=UPI001358504B|nr:alpha/beta hydrolase [Halococcus salsus]
MPTIECNGASLYYEEYGTGRPIVFLHGAWAGLRYFEPQLNGLADEYRTTAFDFRGHGRSEKTDAGHTLAQYARDLRSFLDGRDLHDVVVVGWSMGALVSWEYVAQFGTDRIRALVDVDMEPSPLGSDDRCPDDREQLRELHSAIQSDHLGLVERSIEQLLKNPPSPAMRTTMFDEESRCPPPIKSALLPELLCDYRDVLSTIDVPTLVCAGADEKHRRVASVEAVAELVPDAEFELFAESGHCPTLEEPERFNRVLSKFVESL